MALSEFQRQAFFDRGIVRLSGAFSQADAARMYSRIWDLLEDKYGLRRDDPSTWKERQPTGFQSLTRTGTFNSIAAPAVTEALDEVIGNDEWVSSKSWGVPLVTFPESGRTWDVPVRQWHLDFLAIGEANRLPGVRVFAFVSSVERGGGGTVVAAGVHRLVERLVATGRAQAGHSPAVRGILAEKNSWLRSLWSDERISPLDREQSIDGVNIEVEELTGEPGDVILMHPWTFHAPALNCSWKPRFMISHSVFRKGTLTS